MATRLAVIGGGPKAVAIACKANVLNRAGVLDCAVHVFEEQEVGASWSGQHGYTDGLQSLCTPAEKDLGFPYAAIPGAAFAAAEMMTLASWGAFKAGSGYADWVDLGRAPSSHGEFAAYLRWAFARSGATLHRGKVVALRTAGADAWDIDVGAVPGPGAGPKLDSFDGVVVTGHGPPRRLSRSSQPNLFDGKDFWAASSRSQVASAVRHKTITEDNPLVVIGGGGTSAAVLAWFARQGFVDLPMILLAEQATFYTRGDSVFENRLFSDPAYWAELTHSTRRAFFDRLTRGVVWQAVMQDLVRLSALRFVEGRAAAIVPTPPAGLSVTWTRRLTLAERAAGLADSGQSDAGMVVDATGFDNWWFLDLLPPGAVPPPGSARTGWQGRLADGMGEDLKFRDGWTLPPLHAPFQSIMVGPGFASLLALGDMADRVLRPYMDSGRLSLP